jgi:glycosyltransferase involved in cell wall biosynthesis
MTLKQSKNQTSLEIDVVLTVYNASEVLSELAQKLKLLGKKLQTLYRLRANLIFVDDSSSDGTTELLSTYFKDQKTFKRVTLIELSRNFGQHRAILAGLQESQAPYVLLMDGDIDQDPLFSLKLIDKLLQDPYDHEVVYAYRTTRGGKRNSQIVSNWFWRILQSGVKTKLEVGQMSMRIMKRKYVDELLRYQGDKIFWGAVFQLTGFRQYGIKYESPYQAKSNYNFRKRLQIACVTLLTYSDVPYKIGTLFFAVPSAAIMIYVVMMLQNAGPIQRVSPGWFSIMILLSYQIITQTTFILFLIQYFQTNRKGLSTAPIFHIRNRIQIK